MDEKKKKLEEKKEAIREYIRAEKTAIDLKFQALERIKISKARLMDFDQSEYSIIDIEGEIYIFHFDVDDCETHSYWEADPLTELIEREEF